MSDRFFLKQISGVPLLLPQKSQLPQMAQTEPAYSLSIPQGKVETVTSWQEQFWKLLSEDNLTDLTIDQRGGLWLDRGEGLVAVSWGAKIPDAEELYEFAIDLIALGGRHLDNATPMVDVVLPEPAEVRVHAVLPPIAGAQAVISVRKPARRAKSLSELGAEFIEPEARDIIVQAIASKQNILLSGASGVGKTTMLAAMIAETPSSDRVIAIEDIPELNLERPNYVQLSARQPNTEGAGGVDTRELLIQALRMRPDRIFLGELRGAEFADLLTALNTGHDGGATSCHASSLESLSARLEALGALAGWSPQAVATQVSGALNLVVQLERVGTQRRVAEIGHFVRHSGTLTIERSWVHPHGTRWSR